MSENKSEDKNGLKSFKDINSVDEIDFSKIEIIRGQTPENIEEKCLQLCKDYLSGKWSQQTLDTIEVKRVTGGAMNQLYYCGINEPNNNEDVPQEVAIRLYGQNMFDYCDKERVRDLVISLIFSEQKLGPKIYGVYEGGQIQQFCKHKQFKLEEQKRTDLVEKVFKTLAKIHSLDVPLKKDPMLLYELTVNFYEMADSKYPIKQLVADYNCENLKKYDLKTEIDWFKVVMQKVNSPVMFTHNDFRSSNLLIVEPNDELIVCDYDLSGYGYRGYDFVAMFREWGREQFNMRELNDFPNEDSVFRPVLEIYNKECERIHGKSYSENDINSVEHILKEIKVFTLFGILFETVFCLKMDEKDDDFMFNKKFYMDYAEKSFKYYLKLKKICSERNLI